MDSSNIRTVQAFIDAINRHDVVEIAVLMAPDHTFIDSWGRAQVGRDLMVANWEMYFSRFPDYRLDVDYILADERVVAVFGKASGTYRGPRGTVPENHIIMPTAWQARVEKGVLKLWQVYSDWSEGLKLIEREGALLAEGDTYAERSHEQAKPAD